MTCISKSEFEKIKKEHPEEKFPEYGSLEWKILFLPKEQYDEHQNAIFRFVETVRISAFLETVKFFTHLTPEEEFALDFLFETFNHCDDGVSNKLGLW